MINGQLISQIASAVLQALNATGAANPAASVCMDGRLALVLLIATLTLLFVAIYTKKHKLPLLSYVCGRPSTPAAPLDRTALLAALSELKSSSQEVVLEPPPSPDSSSSSPPPVALFSPRSVRRNSPPTTSPKP
jgi:hypothetical protein